jgi:hypothetical protein
MPVFLQGTGELKIDDEVNAGVPVVRLGLDK